MCVCGVCGVCVCVWCVCACVCACVRVSTVVLYNILTMSTADKVNVLQVPTSQL